MDVSLPHTQKGSMRGSLPMAYVPTSNKSILEANKCLGLDLYALHYGTTGEYKPRDEANLGGKWWPLPLLSCISSGKA